MTPDRIALRATDDREKRLDQAKGAIEADSSRLSHTTDSMLADGVRISVQDSEGQFQAALHELAL